MHIMSIDVLAHLNTRFAYCACKLNVWKVFAKIAEQLADWLLYAPCARITIEFFSVPKAFRPDSTLLECVEYEYWWVECHRRPDTIQRTQNVGFFISYIDRFACLSAGCRMFSDAGTRRKKTLCNRMNLGQHFGQYETVIKRAGCLVGLFACDAIWWWWSFG